MRGSCRDTWSFYYVKKNKGRRDSDDSYTPAPFTGSTGNPVTNGTWKVNADGTWSFYNGFGWYFTASGKAYTDAWACIYGGPGETDNKTENWFYFDSNGRALTGWHKLIWNGEEKNYYFCNGTDGVYGALKEA